MTNRRNVEFSLGWAIWLIILSFPFSLAFAGYQIGQIGANSVRAQYEIQRRAQAEFIKAVQEAGLQVEEAPAVPPATKG